MYTLGVFSLANNCFFKIKKKLGKYDFNTYKGFCENKWPQFAILKNKFK